MKAILRSINNFSCKLKQSNNLKYNISPKIRSNKFKNISGNGNVTIEDAIKKDLKDYKIYGNTYQNSTSGKNICLQANIIDTNTIRFDINSNEINRTFTLSLIPPLSVNSMSIVAFADGVNLRSVGTINLISGERSTTTITLAKSIYNTIQNASEVHFNLYKSGAGISTTSIIEEPQIENNSSFTSYEPYTGGQPSPNPDYPQDIISCGDLITDSQDENYGKYKIPINVNNNITNIYLDEPLRKIDGYSDYIDFINGKIVRNIKKIVLDGSEDWYTSSGTSQVAFNKGVGYIHDTTKLPCNISINCQMPNNNLYFYSTGYSLAAWKTFLSTTNAIVYGRLSTPTEESITLPNINLIEGKNIITIGTEVQGVFETEYYSKEIIDISDYKYNLRKVED